MVALNWFNGLNAGTGSFAAGLHNLVWSKRFTIKHLAGTECLTVVFFMQGNSNLQKRCSVHKVVFAFCKEAMTIVWGKDWWNIFMTFSANILFGFDLFI